MADADPEALKGGGLDGLNATTNGTLTSSILDHLQDINFILLEAKIILGAMGIIFLGAHAALRRPPSAAPPKSKKTGGRPSQADDDRFTQGLERSDAILFPVMAGGLLVGLYYLIQWLKDPAILNKILQWYMSTMSIASLLTLYAHGIDVSTSLVFPRFFKVSKKELVKVDQRQRVAQKYSTTGDATTGRALSSPVPPPLSMLVPKSGRIADAIWDIRELLTKQWAFKIFLRGVGEEKAKFKFAHVLALSMAVASAGIYFTTTSPFLSNMLGYGMCYGSMLLLSPTDFVTGALVLVGLFIYDIVMVFYTPYMVTVATTLDVPIKLTFKAAAHKSILGLGDIVLPGMLIGWTLRFDLWLHYLRKITYESKDLKIVAKDAATGEVITTSETKHMEIKKPYEDVTGCWGEWFWSGGLNPFRRDPLPLTLPATRFSKTYFWASLVGYCAGMLVTLAMLLVYKRGQPALLYLVPGVLGAILLTALARGEMKELWQYTEDGSLDVEDVVVDLDGSGRAVKSLGKLENGVVDTTKSKEDKAKEEEEKEKKRDEAVKSDNKEKLEHAKKQKQVFVMSIEALDDDR